MNDPTEMDTTNPNHYHKGGMEAIDVIEAFGFDYYLGTVFKYMSRMGTKVYPGFTLEESRKKDVRKAAWYLLRSIGEHYNDPDHPDHRLARPLGKVASTDQRRRQATDAAYDAAAHELFPDHPPPKVTEAAGTGSRHRDAGTAGSGKAAGGYVGLGRGLPVAGITGNDDGAYAQFNSSDGGEAGPEDR